MKQELQIPFLKAEFTAFWTTIWIKGKDAICFCCVEEKKVSYMI